MDGRLPVLYMRYKRPPRLHLDFANLQVRQAFLAQNCARGAVKRSPVALVERLGPLDAACDEGEEDMTYDDLTIIDLNEDNLGEKIASATELPGPLRVSWRKVSATVLILSAWAIAPALHAQGDGDIDESEDDVGESSSEADVDVELERSSESDSDGASSDAVSSDNGDGARSGDGPNYNRARTHARDGDIAATKLTQQRVGIGYFTGRAPLGIRYWWEGMGLDAGIGLGFSEVDNPAPTMAGIISTDVFTLSFEVGALFRMATWDNINLFSRVGIGISFHFEDDNYVISPPATVDTDRFNFTFLVDGLIGAEFFLTELGFPNLSFTGGIGGELVLNKQDNRDLSVSLTTTADNVAIVATAALGFHIYF